MLTSYLLQWYFSLGTYVHMQSKSALVSDQLMVSNIKGGGTGLAGLVLAGPLFQEGSKYFPANQRSNENRAGIRTLEYFESSKFE